MLYQGAGINNVGSFQVSGTPWVTGSVIDASGEVLVSFPKITKSITIINNSAQDIRVHFASQDTDNTISGLHYLTLTEVRDSITLNCKAKEIYISNVDTVNTASFSIYAELTGILPSQLPESYSGSGISA